MQKKNVDHGTEVPSRAVFVIYKYDKKKILKSDHSLMVEIKGTKMLTNKGLQDCRSGLDGHRPVMKNSCPPSGR